MLGIFESVFGRDRDKVTSRDIKVALMGVKREQSKKRLALRKLLTKRDKLIERMKKARRDGDPMETDVSWEELRQLKVEATYARREGKVLSLEFIGLTRYLRGLERLERSKDERGIQKLLEKVRKSGLDEKLRGVEIDEVAYLDTLNATLDDLGMELDEMAGVEEEADPEKERFLKEIDAIVAAEDAGKIESAVEREESLKEKLDQESVEEEKLGDVS